MTRGRDEKKRFFYVRPRGEDDIRSRLGRRNTNVKLGMNVLLDGYSLSDNYTCSNPMQLLTLFLALSKQKIVARYTENIFRRT